MQIFKEEDKSKTINGCIVRSLVSGCHGNRAKHLWPGAYNDEQTPYGRATQRIGSLTAAEFKFCH